MGGPDVIVIGGGVIGCAIARHVARGGARVVVLERDRPGQHASWAAAGMLTPLVEADRPSEFLTLLRRSRAMFPALSAALREETDVDVAYRDEGTLLLAFTDQDEAALEARLAWQSGAGIEVHRLDGREARELEPDVSPAVRSALRFPDDHQVDNRLLAGALAVAAERAGAEVRAGVEVRRLLRSGSRVEGVELAGGEAVRAPTVVVAAGCWSAALDGLPRPLPVEPVHGQLIALEAPPPRLDHVVDTPRVYLVPRRDGRLIAGTTVERSGFRTAVTPAGLLSILRSAIEAVPALADRPIVEQWSGLRPGTPDELPILGPDPDVEGLLYATGHFRNGILLAPVTGAAIGELALGRQPEWGLEAFSAARF